MASRFEQRREFGLKERAKQMGVELPKGHATVFLQNTGNVGDNARQEEIYWSEGYDKIAGNDQGILMAIPNKDMQANQKRYMDEGEARLRRPGAAGLEGVKEVSSTAGYAAPVKAEDFLKGDTPDE